MTTTLTRSQGVEHLTNLLLQQSGAVFNVGIVQQRDFYQPQAEALHDMFTNTTPQSRFPQHQVNLIRINAQHNQHDRRFLERQLACWTTNPFQGLEQ